MAAVVEELVEVVALAIRRAEYRRDRRALVEEDEVDDEAAEQQVERGERSVGGAGADPGAECERGEGGVGHPVLGSMPRSASSASSASSQAA
jgi:hypothetical protein